MSLNWPSSILHHLVSTKNQKLSKNFLVPVQMSSNRPSFILHHLVSTKNFQKILFGPPANDIKLNSCANELKLNSCANELKLNSCANEPKLHSYAHKLKSNSDHTTWWAPKPKNFQKIFFGPPANELKLANFYFPQAQIRKLRTILWMFFFSN